jgi:hypothetical protein
VLPSDIKRQRVDEFMTAAAGDAPEWSATGLARGWMASIHGVEGHHEDALADEFSDAQSTKLNLMGQVASRNVADIAAKLAVVVLETAGDASAGALPGALRRITPSALANLVLMGERPPGFAAPTLAGRDAELIAACNAYTRAWSAYNAGEHDRPIATPEDAKELNRAAWVKLNSMEEHLLHLSPPTMAGIVAEAKVAARLARQRDGTMDFLGGPALKWAERVVLGVLRLHGEAA